MIQIGTIESGIGSLLNTSTSSDLNVFMISEARLQTFIWDFAKLEGFEEEVKINQRILEVLGLAMPGDDFSSFYQNLWVDPNGTLYLPDKDMISIVGFDFSEYQLYSFAQAVVQSIRNQQNSYQSLNIYPPCIAFTEVCEINLALAKGEAAFTGWQWVLETFDEQTITKIDEAARKLYFTPVFSPPAAMEAIRLFPYNQGYSFVEVIYQQGGWEGVDTLFIELPTTTEQILHPEKYISGEVGAEIDSTDLSGVLPSEWQPIFQGTLGEWKTYLLLTSGTNLFIRIDEEDALQASEGWNGDQTQIFTTTTGKSLVTAHWKFDSITDAAEFNDTFGRYTSQRFMGDTIEILGYSCIDNGGQVSCLVSKGDDVIWVQGSDSKTVEFVMNNYEILQSD